MMRRLLRRWRADFRAWMALRRFRAKRAQYLAAKARLSAMASRLPQHERARREAEQS